MASRSITTCVLVVGGGPVGLTLAMDLASRGIDVVVAEVRHIGDLPNVKCNHVSARSMEIYRRLGLAQKLRNAGLPPDHRIELRIGVNLGDVIVAPDDIYGHGVNVAARLEGLAPPGGMCISAECLAPCAGSDRRRVRRSRRATAEEHRRSGACLCRFPGGVTPAGVATSSAALVHPKIAVMAWYPWRHERLPAMVGLGGPLSAATEGHAAMARLLFFSCIYRRRRRKGRAALAFQPGLAYAFAWLHG